MLTDKVLSETGKIIESYVTLEKIIDKPGIAHKMGLSTQSEEYERFTEFCDDYLQLVAQKAKKREAIEKKHIDDYCMDKWRIVKNMGWGAALGAAFSPMYEAMAIGAMGAACLTYADESRYGGKTSLNGVWWWTLVGGILGNELYPGPGGKEVGSYIGAGVGAAISIGLSFKGSKRPANAGKEKAEMLRKIEADYQKKYDALISIYSQTGDKTDVEPK